MIFLSVHRIKCKFGYDNKKCETCGTKYKYCNCFLEFINCKDDLIECKYLCCNKNYQRKFDEKLKERFLSFLLIFIFLSSFYHRKKVFILMNIWMIRKIK